MYISISNRTHHWQDYTLIVPTVSVGNVGQLAADLVISTLWMERVGFILHPSLLPCVGNNPFAHEDATSCKMSTCCEVYESTSSQVVVIQQRAPFVKGKRKEYAEWLGAWIKEHKFYQVVILTSSFAQERLDHQLVGSPFRILKSESMEKRSGDFFKTKMGLEDLEFRTSVPASSLAHQDAGLTNCPSKFLYMPGSGIAKMLFDDCCTLPVLVLLMFVSEGDNAGDGLAIADQLNQWLNLITIKKEASKELQSDHVAAGIMNWKIPMSWKLVFGSKFDQKLFQ